MSCSNSIADSAMTSSGAKIGAPRAGRASWGAGSSRLELHEDRGSFRMPDPDREELVACRARASGRALSLQQDALRRRARPGLGQSLDPQDDRLPLTGSNAAAGSSAAPEALTVSIGPSPPPGSTRRARMLLPSSSTVSVHTTSASPGRALVASTCANACVPGADSALTRRPSPSGPAVARRTRGSPDREREGVDHNTKPLRARGSRAASAAAAGARGRAPSSRSARAPSAATRRRPPRRQGRRLHTRP